MEKTVNGGRPHRIPIVVKINHFMSLLVVMPMFVIMMLLISGLMGDRKIDGQPIGVTLYLVFGIILMILGSAMAYWGYHGKHGYNYMAMMGMAGIVSILAGAVMCVLSVTLAYDTSVRDSAST